MHYVIKTRVCGLKMAIRILCDENCLGQVEAVFNDLERLGYVELLEVDLLTWEEAMLPKGIDDETIWRFCQNNNCLLLTGNRTGDDDTESLEYITRTLISPNSLPILTFGNLKRVIPDPRYCRACAQRLADIVFDLENYRGVPRLYLP